MPLLECVPNISEGRRTDVIDALADALAFTGVRLLDRSSDPSHNRSVFTIAGEPEPLEGAVMRLVETAIAHIDLREHRGVHPRVGAVDVVPFVPLAGATMADCVTLARSTARAVWTRCRVPVYLYGEAATGPGRRDLSEIRRGGADGLSARMRQDEWRPDFGGGEPHPTAGVCVIGARPILIAYNVNLASDRIDVARRIARTIRTSSGGLPHVKAMGVRLEHRGIVQVSMNLINYRTTPMTAVFDAVEREAGADGVKIAESEIVGLVPADALPENPVERLRLSPLDAGRVLELRLSRTPASP